MSDTSNSATKSFSSKAVSSMGSASSAGFSVKLSIQPTPVSVVGINSGKSVVSVRAEDFDTTIATTTTTIATSGARTNSQHQPQEQQQHDHSSEKGEIGMVRISSKNARELANRVHSLKGAGGSSSSARQNRESEELNSGRAHQPKKESGGEDSDGADGPIMSPPPPPPRKQSARGATQVAIGVTPTGPPNFLISSSPPPIPPAIILSTPHQEKHHFTEPYHHHDHEEDTTSNNKNNSIMNNNKPTTASLISSPSSSLSSPPAHSSPSSSRPYMHTQDRLVGSRSSRLAGAEEEILTRYTALVAAQEAGEDFPLSYSPHQTSGGVSARGSAVVGPPSAAAPTDSASYTAIVVAQRMEQEEEVAEHSAFNDKTRLSTMSIYNANTNEAHTSIGYNTAEQRPSPLVAVATTSSVSVLDPTSSPSAHSLAQRHAALVIRHEDDKATIAALERQVATLTTRLQEKEEEEQKARKREKLLERERKAGFSNSIADGPLSEQSQCREEEYKAKEMLYTAQQQRSTFAEKEKAQALHIIDLTAQLEAFGVMVKALEAENAALKSRVSDEILLRRQTNRLEMASQRAKSARLLRLSGLRRLEAMERAVMATHDDIYHLNRFHSSLSAPVRDVTFVCMYFNGIDVLGARQGVEAARSLIGMYQSIISRTAQIYKPLRCFRIGVCNQFVAFVFQSASAALNFAVDVQLYLLEQPWPEQLLSEKAFSEIGSRTQLPSSVYSSENDKGRVGFGFGGRATDGSVVGLGSGGGRQQPRRDDRKTRQLRRQLDGFLGSSINAAPPDNLNATTTSTATPLPPDGAADNAYNSGEVSTVGLDGGGGAVVGSRSSPSRTHATIASLSPSQQPAPSLPLFAGPRVQAALFTCNPTCSVDATNGLPIYTGRDVLSGLEQLWFVTRPGEITANDAWGERMRSEGETTFPALKDGAGASGSLVVNANNIANGNNAEPSTATPSSSLQDLNQNSDNRNITKGGGCIGAQGAAGGGLLGALLSNPALSENSRNFSVSAGNNNNNSINSNNYNSSPSAAASSKQQPSSATARAVDVVVRSVVSIPPPVIPVSEDGTILYGTTEEDFVFAREQQSLQAPRTASLAATNVPGRSASLQLGGGGSGDGEGGAGGRVGSLRSRTSSSSPYGSIGGDGAFKTSREALAAAAPRLIYSLVPTALKKRRRWWSAAEDAAGGFSAVVVPQDVLAGPTIASLVTSPLRNIKQQEPTIPIGRQERGGGSFPSALSYLLVPISLDEAGVRVRFHAKTNNGRLPTTAEFEGYVAASLIRPFHPVMLSHPLGGGAAQQMSMSIAQQYDNNNTNSNNNSLLMPVAPGQQHQRGSGGSFTTLPLTNTVPPSSSPFASQASALQEAVRTFRMLGGGGGGGRRSATPLLMNSSANATSSNQHQQNAPPTYNNKRNNKNMYVTSGSRTNSGKGQAVEHPKLTITSAGGPVDHLRAADDDTGMMIPTISIGVPSRHGSIMAMMNTTQRYRGDSELASHQQKGHQQQNQQQHQGGGGGSTRGRTNGEDRRVQGDNEEEGRLIDNGDGSRTAPPATNRTYNDHNTNTTPRYSYEDKTAPTFVFGEDEQRTNTTTDNANHNKNVLLGVPNLISVSSFYSTASASSAIDLEDGEDRTKQRGGGGSLFLSGLGGGEGGGERVAGAGGLASHSNSNNGRLPSSLYLNTNLQSSFAGNTNTYSDGEEDQFAKESSQLQPRTPKKSNDVDDNRDNNNHDQDTMKANDDDEESVVNLPPSYANKSVTNVATKNNSLFSLGGSNALGLGLPAMTTTALLADLFTQCKATMRYYSSFRTTQKASEALEREKMLENDTYLHQRAVLEAICRPVAVTGGDNNYLQPQSHSVAELAGGIVLLPSGAEAPEIAKVVAAAGVGVGVVGLDEADSLPPPLTTSAPQGNAHHSAVVGVVDTALSLPPPPRWSAPLLRIVGTPPLTFVALNVRDWQVLRSRLLGIGSPSSAFASSSFFGSGHGLIAGGGGVSAATAGGLASSATPATPATYPQKGYIGVATPSVLSRQIVVNTQQVGGNANNSAATAPANVNNTNPTVINNINNTFAAASVTHAFADLMMNSSANQNGQLAVGLASAMTPAAEAFAKITRLYRRHTIRLCRALEGAIVRDNLEDAFLIVFASPAAALRFCCEWFVTLAKESEWPSGPEVGGYAGLAPVSVPESTSTASAMLLSSGGGKVGGGGGGPSLSPAPPSPALRRIFAGPSGARIGVSYGRPAQILTRYDYTAMPTSLQLLHVSPSTAAAAASFGSSASTYTYRSKVPTTTTTTRTSHSAAGSLASGPATTVSSGALPPPPHTANPNFTRNFLGDSVFSASHSLLSASSGPLSSISTELCVIGSVVDDAVSLSAMARSGEMLVTSAVMDVWRATERIHTSAQYSVLNMGPRVLPSTVSPVGIPAVPKGTLVVVDPTVPNLSADANASPTAAAAAGVVHVVGSSAGAQSGGGQGDIKRGGASPSIGSLSGPFARPRSGSSSHAAKRTSSITANNTNTNNNNNINSAKQSNVSAAASDLHFGSEDVDDPSAAAPTLIPLKSYFTKNVSVLAPQEVFSVLPSFLAARQRLWARAGANAAASMCMPLHPTTTITTPSAAGGGTNGANEFMLTRERPSAARPPMPFAPNSSVAGCGGAGHRSSRGGAAARRSTTGAAGAGASGPIPIIGMSIVQGNSPLPHYSNTTLGGPLHHGPTTSGGATASLSTMYPTVQLPEVDLVRLSEALLSPLPRMAPATVTSNAAVLVPPNTSSSTPTTLAAKSGRSPSLASPTSSQNLHMQQQQQQQTGARGAVVAGVDGGSRRGVVPPNASSSIAALVSPALSSTSFNDGHCLLPRDSFYSTPEAPLLPSSSPLDTTSGPSSHHFYNKSSNELNANETIISDAYDAKKEEGMHSNNSHHHNPYPHPYPPAPPLVTALSTATSQASSPFLGAAGISTVTAAPSVSSVSFPAAGALAPTPTAATVAVANGDGGGRSSPHKMHVERPHNNPYHHRSSPPLTTFSNPNVSHAHPLLPLRGGHYPCSVVPNNTTISTRINRQHFATANVRGAAHPPYASLHNGPMNSLVVVTQRVRTHPIFLKMRAKFEERSRRREVAMMRFFDQSSGMLGEVPPPSHASEYFYAPLPSSSSSASATGLQQLGGEGVTNPSTNYSNPNRVVIIPEPFSTGGTSSSSYYNTHQLASALAAATGSSMPNIATTTASTVGSDGNCYTNSQPTSPLNSHVDRSGGGGATPATGSSAPASASQLQQQSQPQQPLPPPLAFTVCPSVFLVYIDLEGSGALYSYSPDAFIKAQAHFNAIILDLVKRFDGYVVKHNGLEGFVVALPCPTPLSLPHTSTTNGQQGAVARASFSSLLSSPLGAAAAAGSLIAAGPFITIHKSPLPSSSSSAVGPPSGKAIGSEEFHMYNSDISQLHHYQRQQQQQQQAVAGVTAGGTTSAVSSSEFVVGGGASETMTMPTQYYTAVEANTASAATPTIGGGGGGGGGNTSNTMSHLLSMPSSHSHFYPSAAAGGGGGGGGGVQQQQHNHLQSVGNLQTASFHRSSCSSASAVSPQNHRLSAVNSLQSGSGGGAGAGAGGGGAADSRGYGYEDHTLTHLAAPATDIGDTSSLSNSGQTYDGAVHSYSHTAEIRGGLDERGERRTTLAPLQSEGGHPHLYNVGGGGGGGVHRRGADGSNITGGGGGGLFFAQVPPSSLQSQPQQHYSLYRSSQPSVNMYGGGDGTATATVRSIVTASSPVLTVGESAAAANAVRFAFALQTAMTSSTEWPNELLRHELAAKVRDPKSGTLLLNGPRARVGIVHGYNCPTIYNTRTRRTDFVGPLVFECVRIGKSCPGGDVWLSPSVYQMLTYEHVSPLDAIMYAGAAMSLGVGSDLVYDVIGRREFPAVGARADKAAVRGGRGGGFSNLRSSSPHTLVVVPPPAAAAAAGIALAPAQSNPPPTVSLSGGGQEVSPTTSPGASFLRYIVPSTAGTWGSGGSSSNNNNTNNNYNPAVVVGSAAISSPPTPPTAHSFTSSVGGGGEGLDHEQGSHVANSAVIPTGGMGRTRRPLQHLLPPLPASSAIHSLGCSSRTIRDSRHDTIAYGVLPHALAPRASKLTILMAFSPGGLSSVVGQLHLPGMGHSQLLANAVSSRTSTLSSTVGAVGASGSAAAAVNATQLSGSALPNLNLNSALSASLGAVSFVSSLTSATATTGGGANNTALYTGGKGTSGLTNAAQTRLSPKRRSPSSTVVITPSATPSLSALSPSPSLMPNASALHLHVRRQSGEVASDSAAGAGCDAAATREPSEAGTNLGTVASNNRPPSSSSAQVQALHVQQRGGVKAQLPPSSSSGTRRAASAQPSAADGGGGGGRRQLSTTSTTIPSSFTAGIRSRSSSGGAGGGIAYESGRGGAGAKGRGMSQAALAQDVAEVASGGTAFVAYTCFSRRDVVAKVLSAVDTQTASTSDAFWWNLPQNCGRFVTAARIGGGPTAPTAAVSTLPNQYSQQQQQHQYDAEQTLSSSSYNFTLNNNAGVSGMVPSRSRHVSPQNQNQSPTSLGRERKGHHQQQQQQGGVQAASVVSANARGGGASSMAASNLTQLSSPRNPQQQQQQQQEQGPEISVVVATPKSQSNVTTSHLISTNIAAVNRGTARNGKNVRSLKATLPSTVPTTKMGPLSEPAATSMVPASVSVFTADTSSTTGVIVAPSASVANTLNIGMSTINCRPTTTAATAAATSQLLSPLPPPLRLLRQKCSVAALVDLIGKGQTEGEAMREMSLNAASIVVPLLQDLATPRWAGAGVHVGAVGGQSVGPAAGPLPFAPLGDTVEQSSCWKQQEQEIRKPKSSSHDAASSTPEMEKLAPAHTLPSVLIEHDSVDVEERPMMAPDGTGGGGGGLAARNALRFYGGGDVVTTSNILHVDQQPHHPLTTESSMLSLSNDPLQGRKGNLGQQQQQRVTDEALGLVADALPYNSAQKNSTSAHASTTEGTTNTEREGGKGEREGRVRADVQPSEVYGKVLLPYSSNLSISPHEPDGFMEAGRELAAGAIAVSALTSLRKHLTEFLASYYYDAVGASERVAERDVDDKIPSHGSPVASAATASTSGGTCTVSQSGTSGKFDDARPASSLLVGGGDGVGGNVAKSSSSSSARRVEAASAGSAQKKALAHTPSPPPTPLLYRATKAAPNRTSNQDTPPVSDQDGPVQQALGTAIHSTYHGKRPLEVLESVVYLLSSLDTLVNRNGGSSEWKDSQTADNQTGAKGVQGEQVKITLCPAQSDERKEADQRRLSCFSSDLLFAVRKVESACGLPQGGAFGVH